MMPLQYSIVLLGNDPFWQHILCPSQWPTSCKHQSTAVQKQAFTEDAVCPAEPQSGSSAESVGGKCKGHCLPTTPMVNPWSCYSSEQSMGESNRKTSTTTLLQIKQMIYKGSFQHKPFYDKSISSLCNPKYCIELFTCGPPAVSEPKPIRSLSLLTYHLQPHLVNTFFLN